MAEDRRFAMLQNILTASEARSAKLRQAEEEYSSQLRQLLAQALNVRPGADPVPEVTP